ncbi:hypothetical protein ACMV5I_27200, partial [Serratia sp. T13T92]
MNTLHRLAAALWLSAYCTSALATGIHEDNREFLRQQENLSNQLRQQDNAPLRQRLEQQVRQNPLSGGDRQFIGKRRWNPTCYCVRDVAMILFPIINTEQTHEEHPHARRMARPF